MEKKMKRLMFFVFSLVLISISFLYANGVGVVNATDGTYLTLISSQVDVSVESQISVVTTTQTFRNDLNSDVTLKYAFPLPEGASAIDLFWKINGQWYQAIINEVPQDTTLPGPGYVVQSLLDYLGDTPLIFTIPDTLKADSLLIVKLVYVELLPYSFGNVDFHYPNDYHLIQSTNLDVQELNFNLISPRTITNIQVLSNHPVTTLVNNGNDAQVQIQIYEAPATENYHIQYSLDLNQLGLFDYSTLIPDSLLPDSLGGFFTFIAEPDPSSSAVINKVFTLMIDRSGSMSGNKIVQARDAATFVVNNLNQGDKFNIVDFASTVSSFRYHHVPYTPQSRDSALTYISNLTAGGGTNISGAFDVAVPQFSAANDSTANIIIFFTDGQPTVGITNIQNLVNHVDTLIAQTETNIFLFTFGIGSNANQQLLTLLANHHNGLAQFLGDDDLYSVISKFYLKIRNPVLLNTQISFDPPVIHEVYPDPLPNLYIGEQMIVSGRYLQAVPVTVTFQGQAFNQTVTHQYTMNLVDSMVVQYQFLTKLWAKRKIEYLLVIYYSLNPNSPQAEAIKQQIINLSISYGVISPFTGFSGGNPVGIEEEETVDGKEQVVTDFELLGNYPNPFNSSTIIRIKINKPLHGLLQVKIYNTLGQLVRILYVHISGPGIYEVVWDGQLSNGLTAASGRYIYIVDFKNTILVGEMTLLK
jgi:Ca-activated chloride channel family protein